MKSNKKIWIIGAALVFLLILAAIIINYVKSPTKLTIEEKNWINDSSKNVANIMVLNNDGVFGSAGKGVFYDFLNDFSLNYNITINPVTYNYGEEATGLYLGKANTVGNTDSVFYKDHYVLLAKDYELIKNAKDLNGRIIGIANSNMSYVSSYLADAEINYASYDATELTQALTNGTVSYIIVPLYENIDFILNQDLSQ